MGVNITTIDYLRVLIIEIGSTIVLMVVGIPGYRYYTWPYLKPGVTISISHISNVRFRGIVYSNTNAILEKKQQGVKQKLDIFQQKLNMGVSLNGGTPKTPQNDHF